MKIQQILTLPENSANKQAIVLFDDQCSLCSSSVRFLLRHNHSGNLTFCSLQSKVGSEIVKLAGKTFQQADTLMLLHDNMLYGSSTAALKISAHLSFPWYLFRILILVPHVIRDAFYRFISKNRYRWFGRKSFCMTDNIVYQKRFLS